jgi:hypothetical protein
MLNQITGRKKEKKKHLDCYERKALSVAQRNNKLPSRTVLIK